MCGIKTSYCIAMIVLIIIIIIITITKRLSLIVRVNVVLNRTVVVDSD